MLKGLFLIIFIVILIFLWSCCVVAKESDESIRGESNE